MSDTPESTDSAAKPSLDDKEQQAKAYMLWLWEAFDRLMLEHPHRVEGFRGLRKMLFPQGRPS